MNFRAEAERAALSWKGQSDTLSDDARQAGLYGMTSRGPFDVCLPPTLATLNLLPDARAVALDRFARAGIAWHHGSTTVCGNHLLSSQVQCANALAPMVDQPERLAATFGGVLDIAAVIPFGDPVAEVEDCVGFEWNGLVDHLGEWHRESPRTRGANTTSADAAIRYRTSTGSTEVALIEWKYVERYDGQPLSGTTRHMAVRHGRYRSWWNDAIGPIRTDRVRYVDLFVEPVYQLLRLQLLAHAMEQTHELGADVVRVVLAAPARNAALRSWLRRAPFDAVVPEGSRTVPAVWRALLRNPDRFVVFDTAQLVNSEAVTSAEFRRRYGHLAV